MNTRLVPVLIACAFLSACATPPPGGSSSRGAASSKAPRSSASSRAPRENAAPARPRRSGESRSEVVVFGMIHRGHIRAERYGIEDLKEAVRRVDPDYILCEIPPERLGPALQQYAGDGTITEPRVSVFPEYVDAIIPLAAEMDFTLIGCAGWTQEMADDRRDLLIRWETERPDATAEIDEAQAEADRRIRAGGTPDDPRWIHTDAYDAIVKRGLEPYNRLFNDDLGAGGWDNVNKAHYAHIAAAIDAYGGAGKRFLVTFGAWHKYWFLERLRDRDDVVVLDAGRFFDR